jgi:hypothetical protein
MFTTPYNRQLTTSPQLFGPSLYSSAEPTMYAEYDQRTTYAPMPTSCTTASIPLQSQYLPQLSNNVVPASNALKYDTLYVADDSLCSFDLSYAAMAGTDMAFSQGLNGPSSRVGSTPYRGIVHDTF